MLGFELLARRKRLRLTQACLAKLIGCSAITLRGWEQGLRPIPRGQLIALQSVLSRIEAGELPVPRIERPAPRKRHPVVQAIRQWILSHL